MGFALCVGAEWTAYYVPGAPNADRTFLIFSIVAGTLALIITSALTTRWSDAYDHASAAGAGTLAGWMVGGMTFALFGAPAAGVVGNQAIYPSIVSPPQTLNLYAYVDSVVSTVFWTYGMGWTMLLGGGLIGGLVGVVSWMLGSRSRSSSGSKPMSLSIPLLLMLFFLFIASYLILIGDIVVYALLMDSAGKTASQVHYSIPPVFALYTIIESAIAVMIALLLLLLLWGRELSPDDGPTAKCTAWVFYCSGVVCILITVPFFWNQGNLFSMVKYRVYRYLILWCAVACSWCAMQPDSTTRKTRRYTAARNTPTNWSGACWRYHPGISFAVPGSRLCTQFDSGPCRRDSLYANEHRTTTQSSFQDSNTDCDEQLWVAGHLRFVRLACSLCALYLGNVARVQHYPDLDAAGHER